MEFQLHFRSTIGSGISICAYGRASEVSRLAQILAGSSSHASTCSEMTAVTNASSRDGCSAIRLGPGFGNGCRTLSTLLTRFTAKDA
jgi:hypothetical protein